MDRDSLTLFLSQGLSLEQIGRRVDRHPSTVAYWVKKHGLESVHREHYSARGAIPRERLAALVEEDATYAFMADALDVSVATIRYWLKKYDLETRRGERIRLGRENRVEGRAIVQLTCRHHGVTRFWLEGRGIYRCMQCRQEAVVRRREAVRATLIAEAGGCCAICSYSRCSGALQFHHLVPRQKRFTIRDGSLRGLDVLRAEARKCVLLCANCHAEVEAGVKALPARVSGSVQESSPDDD